MDILNIALSILRSNWQPASRKTSNFVPLPDWLSLREHCTSGFFRMLRSRSLLGRARQPLGDRNHSSGVLRSHSGHEIVARASFRCIRQRLSHRTGYFCSHIPLEIIALACSAVAGHAESLSRRASKPASVRTYFSSRLLLIRSPFCFSSEDPFEIALVCIAP